MIPAQGKAQHRRTHHCHTNHRFACSLLAAALGHVGATAWVATALLVAPHAAFAQAARSYSIPAGTLEDALNRFGRESRILLSFSSGTTTGLKSKGLQGDYTPQSGLDALLAGSGLQAAAQPNGSYVLVRAVASIGADSSRAGSQSLAEVRVTAQAEKNMATEATGRYVSSGSTVGGKTLQSAREVPQSVSLVTRQQIEDEALTTLPDVLKAMPGVTVFQGSMLADRFLSRGFEIAADNMRVDGGATLARGFGIDNDLAFYDHIEVLRGADGLFGGNGEPGGVINLVRKKPTYEKQVLVQTQLGSDNFRRADLDVSGPLAEDGRIRGRAVLAQESKHFFFDVADSKRTMAYGILEADLTPDTTLSMGASHVKRDSSYQGYGLPRASTGEDLRLPRSTYLSGADDRANKDVTSVFGHVSHSLSGDWKLDVDANYDRAKQERFDHYFNGAADLLTGAGTMGGANFQTEHWKNASLDVSLKGRFDGLGRRHDVVLGGSWARLEADAVQSRPAPYVGNQVPDIYAFDPFAYRRPDALTPWNSFTNPTENAGVYGAVRLQVAEPMHVIAGGRWGQYKYTYQTTRTDPSGVVTSVSSTQYEDSSIFTPYVATTYQLGKTWTGYGSIAETFKSQASYRSGPAPGTPLDPVTGRNYEIGLKGEHLGGRVHSAFAVYRIDRDGAAVRDSAYPASSGDLGSTCCFAPTGRIVSKGVDAEVSGELLKGLHLSLSYNYNDNRNKNAASDGRYNGVHPAHMLKVFAAYQLPGQYGQWKLGGGASVQSKTYLDDYAYLRNPDGKVSNKTADYRITQAGYAVASAFVEYKIDSTWTASLNVNNLFDKTYYSTIGYLDYGSFYGAPRNVMLTLRGRF